MTVYFILLIIPFLAVLFRASGYSVRFVHGKSNRLEENYNKNTAIILFFLIYFLLLALRRSDVGADVNGYLMHFERAQTHGWIDYLRLYSSEHGFYILNKLISIFTQNEQIYLAVIAAVTVFPIMYFYYKESEDQMLTISFFIILPVFTMFFSGLRQSIAIALMVPAYYMVKSRKPIKFVLIVLLASFFHISALIALLLYPIYYIKWSRKMLIWIVPTLIVTYVFNAQIYMLLVPLLGEEYSSYGEVTETGAYMMLLLFVLCLVFSYFLLEDEYADEETLGLRNILVLATAIQCFAASNSIASRMNYYFMIFIPILMPKVIGRTSLKNRKWCIIIGWIMIMYFIFYFFRRAYTGADILQTFPYYAFWEKTGGF